MYCSRLFVLWLRRKYSRSEKKRKKIFFLLLFAHLIVPLASPKVLSLDNKNKLRFILYCSRLFVPLQQ